MTSFSSIDIPVIETERLRLRAFEERDFPTVAAYKADPDVMRFTGGPEPELGAWKSFAAMIGSWALRGFGYFCVAEKVSDSCIGHCGLLYPPGWPERELGYSLAGQAHGKGYATEAAGAVLRYAYQTLGWSTAISVISADNHASKGVAQKLGASRERLNVPIHDFTADIWRHLPPEEFFSSNP